MRGFLDYIPGESLIHHLDSRTKLILPLLICVGCFSAGSIYLLLVYLAINIIIGYIGKIQNQTWRILKGLLKISIFLFILQILFIQKGEPLFPLLFGLAITKQGVYTAIMVVLRLVCATMALALMISMTKLTDLSNSLVSKWGIPYKYAFAITSSIRFIPTFATDMQTIMEVQTARGVSFDTKNIIKKIGLLLPICVPLLVSSVERANSAAIAAELRGFNLRGRNSSYNVTNFAISDVAVLVIGVILAAVGIIF